MRVTAIPMDQITEQDFKDFVEVRNGGLTNMMMTANVSALSGLSRETVMGILTNFDALSDKYPGIA